LLEEMISQQITRNKDLPANLYFQMENFGRELVEGTHANRMGHFPEIEENLKGNK
jgi:hypothetical protein